MSEILSRTVGPKAAKKAIRKGFAKRRPIFLWGPPGIGKSDIVKQILINFRPLRPKCLDLFGVRSWPLPNQIFEYHLKTSIAQNSYVRKIH